MKVTTEDRDALSAAIVPLDTDEHRDAYRRGDFPRADLVKDLDKRYRWDLFWAARRSLTVNLQNYNDSHLDTALRSIVSPLGEVEDDPTHGVEVGQDWATNRPIRED